MNASVALTNMEFASPPPIPPSGAQRAPRAGRCYLGGLHISSRTQPGEFAARPVPRAVVYPAIRVSESQTVGGPNVDSFGK